MGDKLFFTVLLFAISGVLNEVASSNLRVVGGYTAPSEFGKFHVSLQNLTGYHVCGGAVVSKSYAVTAAHCVSGADPKYIKFVIGTTDLEVDGLRYDVEAIVIHPEYNVTTRGNDIALVKIAGVLDLNKIDVLGLDENPLLEGDTVILTGFGAQTPNGESSRFMYALNLPVFNQETCVYAMRNSREVLDTMFCTFTQIGEGTCHGDSGGPLIKNEKLVGLVSWGIPCAVGFPDVHTRISPYVQWIKKSISPLKCKCNL